MQKGLSIFKTRAFWLSYLAFVVVFGMWSYVNQNLYKQKAAVETEVNLVMNPATNPAGGEFAAGTDQHTDLFITAAKDENKVDAFDITVKAEGQIEITGFGTPVNLDGGNDDKWSKLGQTVDGSTGRVIYVFVDATSETQPVSPHSVRIPVAFKGKGAGAGKLTVDVSKVEITGNIPNHTYTVGTVTNGEFNFTGAGTPTSGNVKLNLKARFQGIQTKPKASNKMRVRVKLGGPQDTGYQLAELTADDAGVYQGSTSFNVPVGSGYTVYVKGEKHIQKKICVAKPTETAEGTYRCAKGTVTLQAGDNDIDLSGIRLLVGDLPKQENDPASQDGVIDSYDTSFIRQLVANQSQQSDAKNVAIGDLNATGSVDNQDFSLILSSLSVKFDEE